MQRAVGVLAMEHIAAALVEGHQLAGALRLYPQDVRDDEGLPGMPAEDIVDTIRRQIDAAAGGSKISAIGVGFPGIVRNGTIEESPNLPQVKGLDLRKALSAALEAAGMAAPVLVLNDADAVAAGIAATRGQLEKVVRVWTLGIGIGFGRYPQSDGAGEGGHIVVSLDPKERFCGCGGQGHLEGIMGHRAMRLRFLDMEPDEIFAGARAGDPRCVDFVRLWHRALAGATATSIHLDGPGKFFVSGPNARFLDLAVLDGELHEMVKMSPLQGGSFEVVATSDEIAIIGAATNAVRSASRS